MGPHIIPGFRKLEIEKIATHGYYMLSMSYALSPFQNFESYLRIVVGFKTIEFIFCHL